MLINNTDIKMCDLERTEKNKRKRFYLKTNKKLTLKAQLTVRKNVFELFQNLKLKISDDMACHF